MSRFDKLWAEEYAPLSRELRTPELLPAHVSVGYWWQNTQSSILLLDKYSCDFVSHPNKRMYRTGSTASLCAAIARSVMRGVRTLQEQA
jgi:hypothetical protein